jgi:hypothetical protein
MPSPKLPNYNLIIFMPLPKPLVAMEFEHDYKYIIIEAF